MDVTYDQRSSTGDITEDFVKDEVLQNFQIITELL